MHKTQNTRKQSTLFLSPPLLYFLFPPSSFCLFNIYLYAHEIIHTHTHTRTNRPPVTCKYVHMYIHLFIYIYIHIYKVMMMTCFLHTLPTTSHPSITSCFPFIQFLFLHKHIPFLLCVASVFSLTYILHFSVILSLLLHLPSLSIFLFVSYPLFTKRIVQTQITLLYHNGIQITKINQLTSHCW